MQVLLLFFGIPQDEQLGHRNRIGQQAYLTEKYHTIYENHSGEV